jgi:hypothetical protein
VISSSEQGTDSGTRGISTSVSEVHDFRRRVGLVGGGLHGYTMTWVPSFRHTKAPAATLVETSEGVMARATLGEVRNGGTSQRGKKKWHQLTKL